ncbi:hypothetical protein [Alkalihalobacillus sp. AL-G]|uniref:hypothetical protein n=1 Tax=Alkalihalobacillus sp. AL-G TaxID=2926399 RepID=UPI00272C46C9|nr:hypothetical protein [Alkalihalobacillus sp. AL-G]WLD92041.1 hypothetical protein MOJ78_13485 [Alkalihalobacillus sp. AL-G]
MEIYLSPEFIKEEAQVLNIVDQNQKAVGYIAFILKDKKMYVYGQLEKEGVSEDFKDLVKPYIEGMGKSKEELEVYTYLAIGGKKIDLEQGEIK